MSRQKNVALRPIILTAAVCLLVPCVAAQARQDIDAYCQQAMSFSAPDGLILGTADNPGSLIGPDAGLDVYADLSGWGMLENVALYGEIAPGNSPGHQTVLSGGATLTSSSTTTFELGGTNQAVPEFDYITLMGTLTIQSGATMDVVWYGGFEASDNDSFEIFDIQTGGGFSGTFTTVNLPAFTVDPSLNWDITKLYSDGIISVTGDIIPEPATVGLLAIGGLAVLVRRRRRHDA